MKWHIYILWVVAGVTFSSCLGSKQRKSESFYKEHKTDIDALIKNYDALYKKQPFAIGFSDKRFKYYTIQMYTDSVRYIYNTRLDRKLVFEEMIESPLTVEELSTIATQIKNLKCLWIDKSDLYVDGRKTVSTHLSFKSLVFSKPFDENKYYILAFLETSMPKRTTTRKLDKYGYHEVGKNIYFTISSRFR